ncbi:alpha/beta fold hydrolase [Romboutsia sp.]|uniref:alpha/beta fold hydrolase n=1 Tax=Romboutsia sp. TaxID=1965302 RepID=UPI002B594699|nr:alpha/beta fold hydrolase [Romboutsia sp.]HSQ88297.1 alpha/beta fold hydrolase [Romboutsia sp.]
MNFKNIDLAVKSFDNINLHYKKDLVDNPKAVILISHGLAEHCKRYDYVTKKLNSFKYSVYRYDHRGHGLSDGRRGHLNDYNTLFKDMNTMVDLIKSENKNIPIFIIGHGIGGHSLVGFGSNYLNKVDGMIFSSPLICDYNSLTDIKCIENDPFMLIPNSNSHELTHDFDTMDSYENDSLILNSVTLGIYNELNKSCKNMINILSNFNYPCLILHSLSDSIVSYEDSNFLYENISSEDKEVKLLSGLYHKLLDEIVKDEILIEISKWINIRL